jgi:menaquinone-dependent protoporphyrinogen oxidase
VKRAGATFAAIAFTCSACATAMGPAPAYRAPAGPVIATFGGDSAMNARILVAYASATGSTAGVAEAIGKRLSESGVAVDVRPVTAVGDLGPYSAVVVGSAIHGGWLPEAVEFVRANREALARVPTAYFLVCMNVLNGGDGYRKLVAGYLEPVRAIVAPVAEGRFAGAMRFADHPFFRRLGLRLWFAAAGLTEGDHRDWGAIRAWADETRPLLVPSATASDASASD